MSIYNQISPIQGGTIPQAISPTFLDPFVQHAENKNWLGNPIKPEQPKFGSQKKESDLYFSSARPNSIWVSKKLNEWTGGNAVEKGNIDVSPEILDHYYDSFTGGTGRFISNVGATGKSISQQIHSSIYGEKIKEEDEMQLRRLPFVKAFFGSKPRQNELEYIYSTFERSGVDELKKEEIDKFTKQLKQAVNSRSLDMDNAIQMKKSVLKNQYKIKKYKGIQDLSPSDMSKKELIKYIKEKK